MNVTGICVATSSLKSAIHSVLFQENKRQSFQKPELDPQIAEIRKWSEDQRHAQATSLIYGKMMSGAHLNKDDLKYLRAHSPAYYEKALQIQREREAYRREMEGCGSKEDVERLHHRKMNGLCIQANGIVGRDHIPRANMLDGISMRAAAVRSEYAGFINTLKYQSLP